MAIGRSRSLRSEQLHYKCIIWMKHCPTCNQDKPIIEFYKASNGKARGLCKECHNKSVVGWQKTSGKDSRLRSLKKYARSEGFKDKSRIRRKTPSARFDQLLRASKNRNLPSNITLEVYLKLTENNQCIYCMGPLPLSGIGLDRIDNLKGYLLDNVLPCCGECNRIRSDVYTIEEMKTIIGPAVRRLRELRNQLPLVAHGERAAL